MLISLAVDFQAADVATRERFHLAPSHVASLHASLSESGVAELALVSTCNRTELYAWCPDATVDGIDDCRTALAREWMKGSDGASDLLDVAAVRTDLDAARHALRVASGLESQVLGDGQILGQFRRAHGHASSQNTSGPVLHRLFETALRTGKRVQANTGLCSGINSIGAQAVALAARRVGSLTDARVAIVGCGKTGERAARQLSKLGVRNITLLNRSEARATELAAELSVQCAPLEALHDVLATADIAIVATGAQEPIVLPDALRGAMERAARPSSASATTGTLRPLLLIDLSMPRNVHAGVAEIPGVSLVDLDALHPVITAAERERRAAMPAAEAIVETELQDFAEWLAAASARAAIRPLREALADVCLRELAFVTGEEVAERLSKRIVAKMMAAPMLAVRHSLARGESVSELARTMQVLFSQQEQAAPNE